MVFIFALDWLSKLRKWMHIAPSMTSNGLCFCKKKYVVFELPCLDYEAEKSIEGFTIGIKTVEYKLIFDSMY